jgi:hypothetical protein
MAGSSFVLTGYQQFGDLRIAKFLATGDASNGTIPATDIQGLTVTGGPTGGISVYGKLLALETDPGSTGPTDDYDITLLGPGGADRLNAVGLNRDTANSERVAITGAPYVHPGESLTMTFANTSVNSATITIYLTWTIRTI